MPEQVKKRLAEEIKLLEHELTTELPAEIKKAVALGDLSENAEYHMAKQRQVFVNARLGQLKRRMAELSLVNLTNIPRDKAGFGSTVVVFDSTKDEEIVYRLGYIDADKLRSLAAKIAKSTYGQYLLRVLEETVY